MPGDPYNVAEQPAIMALGLKLVTQPLQSQQRIGRVQELYGRTRLARGEVTETSQIVVVGGLPAGLPLASDWLRLLSAAVVAVVAAASAATIAA
jgi:hypothetical protein